MHPNARDVNAVATYGVNAVALKLLPLGLVALAAGVFLLAMGGAKNFWPGLVGAVVGGGLLAYAAIRHLFPSKPLLELSPQGALMRIPGAKEFVIPWREVRGIGLLDITLDDIPTRYRWTSTTFNDVASLIVSREFYDRVIHIDSILMRGPGWETTFIVDEKEAQVALHHELLRAPASELMEAVQLRWRAFGAQTSAAGSPARASKRLSAGSSPHRRSVVVDFMWNPLVLIVGAGALAVMALVHFDVWPFDFQARRQREQEASERRIAEVHRKADEALRRSELAAKEAREQARLRAEKDEQERRLAAARVREIEERERAELAAGGPLPSPSATKIDGHRGAVLALSAAGNERTFVSGGADGAVKLWDTRAAVPLRDVGAHAAPVRAAIILPDGKSAIAGDDAGAIVWRAVPDGETLGAFDAKDDGPVLALAADAQATRLASLHASGIVVIWDVVQRKRLRALDAGVKQLALALSADGQRAVTGGEDGALRVWADANSDPQRTLTGHAGPIRAVALTQDGAIAASGGDDATVRVWSLETGAQIRQMSSHVRPVLAVAIDAKAARVASASADETARLWNVETGAEIRRVESLKGPFHSVALLVRDQFALGADDGTIRLFDPEGRERMRYFPSLSK